MNFLKDCLYWLELKSSSLFSFISLLLMFDPLLVWKNKIISCFLEYLQIISFFFGTMPFDIFLFLNFPFRDEDFSGFSFFEIRCFRGLDFRDSLFRYFFSSYFLSWFGHQPFISLSVTCFMHVSFNAHSRGYVRRSCVGSCLGRMTESIIACSRIKNCWQRERDFYGNRNLIHHQNPRDLPPHRFPVMRRRCVLLTFWHDDMNTVGRKAVYRHIPYQRFLANCTATGYLQDACQKNYVDVMRMEGVNDSP